LHDQAGRLLPVATVADWALPHKRADREAIEALEAAHGGGPVLVIDEAGLLLEATRANVAVVFGDTVVTPPLDGRILPGVTRRHALEVAAELGMRIEIREVALVEVAGADGMVLTGSLAGLSWVYGVSDITLPPPTAAMTAWARALLARWQRDADVTQPAGPGLRASEIRTTVTLAGYSDRDQVDDTVVPTITEH
jgi:para-aminobenzoate synthetase/4-amino-4-deoxychorismate lyase